MLQTQLIMELVEKAVMVELVVAEVVEVQEQALQGVQVVLEVEVEMVW